MAGEELQELWGGKVERSADGAAFTRVGKVIGVKVPEVSFDPKQVTSLDTPDRVHEYRKGFGDPGEFSVTCQYTSDGYDAAMDDQARAATFYRVTLENGDTFEMKVLASATPPEPGELDDTLEFSIKGKVSGAVEFTPGA